MTQAAQSGLLVIDKPAGVTSHDVVALVRRLLGLKRVGHAGTLDPLATGVLVVAVGEATRLIEYLETEPKEYVAGVVFGVTTDTQDMTGVVCAERSCAGLSLAELEAVLPRFRGELLQVPPMVSAVHHQGRRLYDLARRGVHVERAARPITVHALEASEFAPGERASCSLRVVCSAGAYVRTLVHDIGEALGCGAALSALRRTRVGRWSLADACSPEKLADEAVRSGALIPVAEALAHLPRATVDEAGLDRLAHGQPVDCPAEWSAQAVGLLLDAQGRVVALARRVEGRLQPVKVLAGALAATGRRTQAS